MKILSPGVRVIQKSTIDRSSYNNLIDYIFTKIFLSLGFVVMIDTNDESTTTVSQLCKETCVERKKKKTIISKGRPRKENKTYINTAPELFKKDYRIT